MHGSMQNVAPLINQAHRGGMLRLAFLSAVVSLVVSFAAAAAPIPLYNISPGRKTASPTPVSRWPPSPTPSAPSPHCWCWTTVQSSGPPAHCDR